MAGSAGMPGSQCATRVLPGVLSYSNRCSLQMRVLLGAHDPKSVICLSMSPKSGMARNRTLGRARLELYTGNPYWCKVVRVDVNKRI